jgi:hypothetical protein
MKWTVVVAISLLVGGCATLPPFLERWADLDISSSSLTREDSKTSESLYFYQDGLVRLYHGNDEATFRWRVRGPWLEIDTANDRTFQTRMRAVSFTKDRIVVESPTGHGLITSEQFASRRATIISAPFIRARV